MLAGFLIGGFIGWVVGYLVVFSRVQEAVQGTGEFGEAVAGLVATQTIPTAPDTIIFMAIGALIGLFIGRAKTKKSEAQK